MTWTKQSAITTAFTKIGKIFGLDIDWFAQGWFSYGWFTGWPHSAINTTTYTKEATSSSSWTKSSTATDPWS
jgi:hypothetical protein